LVIVAQKNHHTKFFQAGSPDNVPPGNISLFEIFLRLGNISLFCYLIFFLVAGTVIDNKICHPRNYDFYMCAHAGMIVSSRNILLLC